MKQLKYLVVAGIGVLLLSLAGCSDTQGPRTQDPGADRQAEKAEKLRERLQYTQDDR